VTGTQDLPGDAAGVDLPRLRAWCATNVPEFVPEAAVQIAGGHSNITVRITDAQGNHLVLRRPPLHSVLATAHDMGREYRLISAFGPTPLPVPRAVAYCPTDDVIGAPFFLMEFVPGLVLHDQETARLLDPAARPVAAQSFADALAALHGADVDEIGLGDLAKRGEYIARQLRRWHGQYEQSRTSDDPTVDRAHDLLAAKIPTQRESTVVHGDFRLGNCIVGDDGKVRAVLDWEICTLGDPLADVGYVMATWPETEAEAAPFPHSPSLVDGFPPRAVLLDRYAQQSGRDVADVAFYVAFSYFRLACIIQGVYSRALGGAQGDTDDDVEEFRVRSESSARLAEQHAAAL
jgi:aminoglycoside phosphotransferase (APT) family kinase protein